MALRAAFAFAFLFMAGGSSLSAKVDDYAVGQVWEYRVRPQDPGSLLKIQQIDRNPNRAEHRVIYHLSIIGVHLNDPAVLREISHVPVARESLDDSVTRLANPRVPFPDPREGIAEWARVKGGVFTTPINQIIDVVEQTMGKMPAPAPAQ
jgi:hypothetical protein